MLLWMITNEGLAAYSNRGMSQASSYVSSIIMPFYPESYRETGKLSEADKEDIERAIREEFGEETAAELIKQDKHDIFYDDPATWSETEGPKKIDPDFFHFASLIDWEAGVLEASEIPADDNFYEFLYPNSEFLATRLEDPEFQIRFEGLSFEFHAVELLLPTMKLGETAGFIITAPKQQRPKGRPPKWDWEGAIMHLLEQAQTPDGLPTGHGAQAKIEAMIADWFVNETKGQSSASQIRQRASKIMQMIEMPKNT